MNKQKYKHTRFQAWLETQLAQAFLSVQAKMVSAHCMRTFGRYAIVIGQSEFVGCLDNLSIAHRILIHSKMKQVGQGSLVVAIQDRLPIKSESISVAYLAHCLEWVNHPLEILRETYRVLEPEADLVITGFNPWSLWGGCYWFRRWFRRPAWGGDIISIHQLKDWLGLLGFDVLVTETFFFRPPLAHIATLEKFAYLEFLGKRFWPGNGAGFIIRAKKRIIPLTFVKPIWQKQTDFLPESVMDLSIDEEIS